MMREINKKKYILKVRKPYTSEVEKYLKEIWMTEWICSSNKLSGGHLDLDETLKILKGDYILERTIEDHMEVRCHEAVIKYIEEIISQKDAFSIKTIQEIHSRIAVEQSIEYRRNNPVLQNIKYVPVHFKDIPNKLEQLIDWYYSEGKGMNAVRRGVLLHHKLIEIYPYEEATEKMARSLLNYELLKEDIPPIEFKLTQNTYRQMIQEYISKSKDASFYEFVLSAINARLDLFLGLTSGS